MSITSDTVEKSIERLKAEFALFEKELQEKGDHVLQLIEILIESIKKIKDESLITEIGFGIINLIESTSELTNSTVNAAIVETSISYLKLFLEENEHNDA